MNKLWLITLLLPLAVLTGCGGVDVDALPDQYAENTAIITYSGTPAVNEDVRAFQTNLWENIQGNNRCGQCHVEGVQEPAFAHQENINTAYREALKVVNLESPADSLLVTKVAGGHQCWLKSDSNDSADSTCATIMTGWIEDWAGGSSAASSKKIELKAPAIKNVGASKSFPSDPSSFSTIHTLLVDHCAECHVDSAKTPQAPFFSDDDINTAYEAVTSTQKIDLDNPANSRLVVRLRDEFHNCWSQDCQSDANELEAAIAAFSQGISATPVATELVVSKALNISDGIVASGGSRYERDLIALYEFKAGQGNNIYDTSGIEPALNLKLEGQENSDFKWVGGWGIEFITPESKAQGLTTPSKKLNDQIQATGEYSMEAWVTPANVTQEGPASIISYSAGDSARNFSLGQVLYHYNFNHRSSTTDANGEPALVTNDEDLQATLQHVVVTFDPVNGRRIYVNGVFTDDADEITAGNLADWDDSYAFVLGNEVSRNRPWQGKLRLVAIHNRALNQAQITQNFEAGVGQKFFLLFNISDHIDLPESYVMFGVSQFDNYSYLFNNPTFVNLNDVQPDNIPLRGLRIGINGKEAKIGQAYARMDTTLSSSEYTINGQPLAKIGTTIPLEKGVDSDEFFLTFEQLGTKNNVFTEPAPLQPGLPPVITPAPAEIGMRTFDEVNATMAALTTVSPTQSDVQATFETIKQQLPSTEAVNGFLSAHQVAISQLAIEYCNVLIEDTGKRSSYFPDFNFTAPVTTAFTSREQLLNPLLDTMMGSNLSTQPDRLNVEAELNSLIDRLTTCGNSCAEGRTQTVAKATCATILGSAITLIQ